MGDSETEVVEHDLTLLLRMADSTDSVIESHIVIIAITIKKTAYDDNIKITINDNNKNGTY